MSNKFFLDSNVVLYALNEAKTKKEKALELLRHQPAISPQVIFECLNVTLKKFKLSKADALDFSRFLIKYSSIIEETKDVVIDSLMLFDKYGFQVFDSKIVSCALHAGYSILYSEDMQHGLVVENKLTIINPFLQNA